VVLEYKNSSEDSSSTPTQSFYRRLIFNRNQNLIQSDAILVPHSAVAKDAQHQANKKKNKKRGKAREPLPETKQGKSYSSTSCCLYSDSVPIRFEVVQLYLYVTHFSLCD